MFNWQKPKTNKTIEGQKGFEKVYQGIYDNLSLINKKLKSSEWQDNVKVYSQISKQAFKAQKLIIFLYSLVNIQTITLFISKYLA